MNSSLLLARGPSGPRAEHQQHYGGTRGLAIVGDDDGAILYDNLESPEEADEICEVLNAGIGPDWEAVEIELVRRAKRERWRADFLAKFEESVAAQKGGTPQ